MWTSAFRTGRRRGEGHCICIFQMMARSGGTEDLSITGIGHLMVGIMEAQVFLLLFISAQYDITVMLLKVDTLGVRRTFNTISTYLGASILVVIFIFFFYQKDIGQSLEKIGVSEMIFQLI